MIKHKKETTGVEIEFEIEIETFAHPHGLAYASRQ